MAKQIKIGLLEEAKVAWWRSEIVDLKKVHKKRKWLIISNFNFPSQKIKQGFLFKIKNHHSNSSLEVVTLSKVLNSTTKLPIFLPFMCIINYQELVCSCIWIFDYYSYLLPVRIIMESLPGDTYQPKVRNNFF